MTVKELKLAIADLPDNMDVMLEQINDESRYAMAETAEVKPVTFMDEEFDVNPEEWPVVDCFVITDEI